MARPTLVFPCFGFLRAKKEVWQSTQTRIGIAYATQTQDVYWVEDGRKVVYKRGGQDFRVSTTKESCQ